MEHLVYSVCVGYFIINILGAIYETINHLTGRAAKKASNYEREVYSNLTFPLKVSIVSLTFIMNTLFWLPFSMFKNTDNRKLS